VNADADACNIACERGRHEEVDARSEARTRSMP
jgi:hypothetical protein